MENKDRTVVMFSSLMWEFSIALFLFLFVAELLAIQANLSQPVKLNEKLLIPALILFLLYTVYWCIKLFRSFRLPKEMESANKPIE
jgi:ABC-type long-subunit fatty acid transport system fused permease/ATPase subunit